MEYSLDIVESCNILLKKMRGDKRKARKQIIRILNHRQLPLSEKDRLNEMLNYLIYGAK
jgi:hypothetical protein